MAIKVPASKASIKQNQLEFEIPGEKKSVWVPKMQYILAHFRDRIAAASIAANSFLEDQKAGIERDPTEEEFEGLRMLSNLKIEIFIHYFPEDILKKMTGDQIDFIYSEWNKQSKVDLGE